MLPGDGTAVREQHKRCARRQVLTVQAIPWPGGEVRRGGAHPIPGNGYIKVIRRAYRPLAG